VNNPIDPRDCLSVGCMYGRYRMENGIVSCVVWEIHNRNMCKCCMLCKNIKKCDGKLEGVEPLSHIIFIKKYHRYLKYSRQEYHQ
jgi:exonuclease I